MKVLECRGCGELIRPDGKKPRGKRITEGEITPMGKEMVFIELTRAEFETFTTNPHGSTVRIGWEKLDVARSDWYDYDHDADDDDDDY